MTRKRSHKKRRLLQLAVTIIAAVSLWFGHRHVCHLWTEPVVYDGTIRSGDLLVVGDFQRTSTFERWFMRREQNDAERARLVLDLSRQTDVGAMLLLGDLVFDGLSCADWAYFDELMEPLHEHGFVLALGNHDYWGPDELACKHVAARFPWWSKERRWGVERWGDAAIVRLDSNDDVLTESEWNRQREWMTTTLAQLQEDPDVRGIVVATHHPPFTNSTVTDDETHVQRAFVDPLVDFPKVVLFLSGHAHAYEHFEVDGRHYIVSGGGGGPRVTLLQGDEARHTDSFEGPSPRPFHFLRVGQNARGLSIHVRGFLTGQSEPEEIDAVELAWPE